MTNIIKTSAEDGDKYFLQEQELWENLGFDWEGWNATVEKIQQQHSAPNSNKKE